MTEKLVACKDCKWMYEHQFDQHCKLCSNPDANPHRSFDAENGIWEHTLIKYINTDGTCKYFEQKEAK